MKCSVQVRLLGLLLLFCGPQAWAQKPSASPFATPGALVKEVLATLSGEETKTRDMEYFKQLFHPKAQLSVVNARDVGEKGIVVFGLEEFVAVAGKNYQNAYFYEEEIASQIDEYNGIAQVFQSFTQKAANWQEQGINSYQLAYDRSAGGWSVYFGPMTATEWPQQNNI